MIIYSSTKNYYLQQGALQFTLNALGDPNKISVAVAANAAIMAYAKVDNTPIIDYDASLNYRTWRLQASPTHFDRSDKVYVYVRLSKTGDDAMVIFPYEKIPIDPALYDSGSSSSSSGEGLADPNYYYIMLGALTAADNGGVTLVDRDWATGEVLSYGELDTARYWEDESSTELDKMFRLDNNNVIWTQHDLTFVAGAKLRLLRMSNFANNGTVDVTSIARAADITTFNFGANDTSIITTAGMEKYLQLFEGTLESKFIRKDQDDETTHKLTMGEADVTGDADVHGDLSVVGTSKLKRVEVSGTMESDNFEEGLRGWQLDRNGNMEVESLHARSAIITDELIINRQEAQEGDTIYSENDQIELVEPAYSEVTPQEGDNPQEKEWYERSGSAGAYVYTLTTDTSVVSGKTYYSITSYILTLKEKWEGYFTGQHVGNVLRGKINTLAAKEAGVSDYTDAEYLPSQDIDAGGNLYYTSFMDVLNTHNSAPSMLDTNQIQVVLYSDAMVPMARNYPPCPLMAIARWGCNQDPDEPGITEAEKRSRIRRQSLFMLTTTDGHIVKLRGVNKPILEDYNFGATFGELPNFIKNSAGIAANLQQDRDYLYAQGVVVADIQKIDIHGVPETEFINCQEWINGGAQSGTIIIPIWNEQQHQYVDTAMPLPVPTSEYLPELNPSSPYIGYGIYLSGEYNALKLRREIDEVEHNGMRWRCRQRMPILDHGQYKFIEPKWNSPYWDMVIGDDRLTMEIISPYDKFRRGYVNTTLAPYVYYGSIDISGDIDALYWNWYRCMEYHEDGTPYFNPDNPLSPLPNGDFTQQDENWNGLHEHGRTVRITDADIPSYWSRSNKVVFICSCQVNDGKTSLIINNTKRM